MMNTIRVLVIGGGGVIPIHEGVNTGLLEQLRFTRTSTLAQGLETLEASPFQLVLLELSLAGTWPSDSAKKIFRMAQDLPVIGFVSDGETAKILEAVPGGAQDYVLKGSRPDSLTRTIQYAMERKQLTVDSDSGGEQLTKNEESIAHSSHAMRNALTCIFQFGNILIGGLAGELSEEQRQYLGIMLENASSIRNVLDGLRGVAPAGLGECAEKTGPLFKKEI